MHNEPYHGSESLAGHALDAFDHYSASEELWMLVRSLPTEERHLLRVLLDCMRTITADGAVEELRPRFEGLPDQVAQLLLAMLHRMRGEISANCQKRAEEIDHARGPRMMVTRLKIRR